MWVSYHTDGWKAHWCHGSLIDKLIDDAVERGQLHGETRPAESGVIDLPGVIRADREMLTFDVDGFDLTIPRDDIEEYFSMLQEPPRRFSDGTEYYKLHGIVRCIVLSVFQAKSLMILMSRYIA